MGLRAQTAGDEHHIFPYPQPPEGLTMLRERCNFLVFHFWDRADMKKVFDQPEGLNRAFSDWISFMPYCSADTARMSIKSLLEKVNKDGKKLIAVADMAERNVYGDTAQFISEELYLPFAATTAVSKKVPEADRKRFARDLRRINSSSLGQLMPALSYVDINGQQQVFEADTVATMVVIAEVGDTDNTTAAIRFSIDPATRRLQDEGKLSVAWFFNGQLDDSARQELEKLPDTWIRGTLPDADDYFKLRMSPAIYLLDENRRIIMKDRPYTTALQVFTVMDSQR
ncbi:MAG: DUF5106 domain-containing protein [Muribaculaceae bacterium]|nr:DUF5106 domain-containing protein [Muribaculaceae bacterium]